MSKKQDHIEMNKKYSDDNDRFNVVLGGPVRGKKYSRLL